MDQIVDNLQRDKVSALFAENYVILAYLYGSQARGESGLLSDVDIAVLFSANMDKVTRFRHKLILIHELGMKLQRDDVQVVDLQEATPLLRHRVYYDGRLLYCPDDADRIKFETTALRDYVDTAPLRRLKRKYIIQRFIEGSA